MARFPAAGRLCRRFPAVWPAAACLRGLYPITESGMEFSFINMIAQASLVAKLVLVLLLFMSISSWALMIQKALALSAAY